MKGNRIVAIDKKPFITFLDRYILIIILLAFLAYSVFVVAARSFWIDESMVALAIVQSGISPFEPLVAHNQVSPWGFVMITRLVEALFGAGDLQFRIPGILVYLTAVGYFSQFIKRRYGLLVASAITITMLANPLLLRYSTEFKHYLYEFSFVIFLLISYFEMKENITRAKYIYTFSLGLSLFFGVSIIFVVASIFTTEMLSRLKYSFKTGILSHWLLLNLVFFTLFAIWYFASVTPNLKYNLLNYPHIYNVDLGPGNLLNLNHWAKVLVVIITSILIPQSIALLVCLLAVVYLRIKKKITLNRPIFLIPVLVYLFIYLLNFAGFYPILLDRHLLFILPTFYLLFAYALSQFTAIFNKNMFRLIAFFIVVGFSALTLADYHIHNQFFFQEIKPVLKTIKTSDRVFLYFSAQPGYDWYKYSLYPNLPEPVNPHVNAATGLRIPLEEMEANLPKLITEPGAWPTIALLTTTDNSIIYEQYLESQIKAAGKSLLVISHRSGIQLRDLLKESCGLKGLEVKRGAAVYEVDCRQ